MIAGIHTVHTHALHWSRTRLEGWSCLRCRSEWKTLGYPTQPTTPTKRPPVPISTQNQNHCIWRNRVLCSGRRSRSKKVSSRRFLGTARWKVTHIHKVRVADYLPFHPNAREPMYDVRVINGDGTVAENRHIVSQGHLKPLPNEQSENQGRLSKP